MSKSAMFGLGLGLTLALPASAGINTIDAVPGATLLLPHFQVDPVSPTGVRTAFSIGNASPAERLAHVVLWTDRGVPTRKFDVRLNGFGIVDVDLHALFTTGTVPQSTAGGFASCVATLPPPALTAAQVTDLRNAHTGVASNLFGGQCGGVVHGDAIARGYITVDVVASCGTAVPGDGGYFVNGGNGVARNDNVLWGEYSVHHPAVGVAYGDTLVHIQASAASPLTDGTPTADMPPVYDYTFYGRRVNGTGVDNREGLPQQWMGRYSFQDTIAQTTAIVWRDPGIVAPFACGAPPAGLAQREVIAFDHQENASTSSIALLPYASQSLALHDPADADIPFMRGAVVYDLGLPAAVAPFQTRNQGHVSHVYGSAYGGAGLSPAWPVTPIHQNLNYDFLNACSDGADNDGDGLVDFPADPGCTHLAGSVENPACSDGVNNDADGLVDYPADPQCSSLADITEDQVLQCQDGLDNDSDGQIDYPADPHCFHGADDTEAAGVCGDGLDNDGDTLVDFPNDPGCASPTSGAENPQCNDGIDNDGDTFIDHPSDAGCSAASDTQEANPACTDGLDNDGDTKIDFPADPGCTNANATIENPQCDDGIDNDLDSFIDHPSDIGCTGRTDNSEQNLPQCGDGADNDGDGRIDYPQETSCASPSDAFEVPDCADTVDNDFDGAIDFTPDPGCASAVDLNELIGTTTRQCSDGIDNDGSGRADYPADASCVSAYDDVEFGQLIFRNGFE